MKLLLSSKKLRNNTFFLDESINGKYRLLSFTATNNIFNVNDNNNQIYITEGTTPYEITLTNGYYTIDELKSHLQDKMSASLTGTITITINDITNKFTITDTNSYYFTFGTNTNNSANALLGFNETDQTLSTSHTSDNCVDLNSVKQIFINITQNDDRCVKGIDYFSTSLIIQNDSNFGELFRYIKNDNFEQFVKFNNTKSLEIKIHDLDNNDIELNSDYILIFEKC